MRVAVGAELALVPRTGGVRCRRRFAHAGDLERLDRPERGVEDADRRARRLEPDRLGRSRVRVDRCQQRSGGRHQDRPLRRRPAGGRRVQAFLAADRAGPAHRQGAVGPRRDRRHAEDQASSEIEPGDGDAGHRRPAGDRVVRIRRAVRLRPRRQAALEARPRRAERRLVLRSRLRVGVRQLADHLEEPGDRPVRHPEELLHRGVRRRVRPPGVADRIARRFRRGRRRPSSKRTGARSW